MRESINLEKALEIIKKNMTSIIVLTLIMGIIAALITFFLIPPRYQAQTQILVSESEETENTSDQDIETSLQLIGTYSDILQSPIVLENVINNLELDKSFSSLSEQITVVNQEQSQVLTVTVTDESMEEAQRIVNEIVNVFQEQVTSIMNVDNVSILSPSNLEADTDPVSPNPLINITVGIALGLILGLTLAFSRAYFDKSVRDEEDAEYYLDMPVVGSIARIEE
ncbi:YveK family protein [Salinicoccus halodurans]|uniref:Capsular polysaccharide biosynthesis protein n=1 Tax=Salinicoccus halodurans TaxID=407035 RepID=A0A0F7HK64_9STAP|nr:Wzz/FepE/Etk N-terminal domain-containing protein [Salinicoccus halodurans]AKG73467.1 capsule biosynthesis protein [Salinicoccus halodurans]SFK51025.1 Capsular polysaccharide biosynthesis protein [Salinicoccus halodurans]